ncbi:MAG: DUF5615 family PIN-like protein [Candidatus Kapaibacteriota bacterium]|jgi:predicted nuclease of predicted toxin-antitoxin system
MKLKFLADEHFHNGATKGLRLRGVDIQTAQEVGLTSRPDEEVLQYAAEMGRIAVTCDKHDFTILHRDWIVKGRTHAGILLLRQYVDVKIILRKTFSFIEEYDNTDTKEQIFFR